MDVAYEIGAECPYYSIIQNRLDFIPLEELDTGVYIHKHLKMLIQCRRPNEGDLVQWMKVAESLIKGNDFQNVQYSNGEI